MHSPCPSLHPVPAPSPEPPTSIRCDAMRWDARRHTRTRAPAAQDVACVCVCVCVGGVCGCGCAVCVLVGGVGVGAAPQAPMAHPARPHGRRAAGPRAPRARSMGNGATPMRRAPRPAARQSQSQCWTGLDWTGLDWMRCLWKWNTCTYNPRPAIPHHTRIFVHSCVCVCELVVRGYLGQARVSS